MFKPILDLGSKSKHHRIILISLSSSLEIYVELKDILKFKFMELHIDVFSPYAHKLVE